MKMDFDLQYIFLKEYIFLGAVQGLMQIDTCYTVCSETVAAFLPENRFTS